MAAAASSPPMPAAAAAAAVVTAARPPAPKKVALWQHLVFSGVSGAVATTCIYPIDLTKTMLQDQRGVGSARQFSGPLDVVRKTVRAHGPTGLYRGWPPNVLLVMPEKALKLTLNAYFRKMLGESSDGRLGAARAMLAGGLAGTCQVVATNPMELLKIQGATMAQKFKAGEIKEMVGYGRLTRQLGVSGVYTGVAATLIRDVPFSMLYFSMYGACSTRFHDAGLTTGPASFAAGAVAGTLAAAVTTPLDVIKTRVHSNATAAPLKGSPSELALQFLSRERDLLRTNFAEIIEKEGAAALFRGVVPRSIIIAPLFAITMTCYEELKERFV